jgi:hypothetical protein
MRSKLLAVGVLATMWACGGATFVSGIDGGDDGGGGSSSGGSSGGSSSGSSGGGGSSSGSSGGGGSSSGGSSGGGSSSGGSSGGGSGGSSGSVDSGSTVCPASPPAANSPCPMVGLDCEYGSNPNDGCNEIASCVAAGWAIETPGAASCPTGTCPATFADVSQNKACSPQGLDCAYPEGQCNCSRTAPISVGPSPVWQCATPTAGCPEPRPRLGDACSQPSLFCDYGACTGGIGVECTDGFWQREATACPASSAAPAGAR